MDESWAQNLFPYKWKFLESNSETKGDIKFTRLQKKIVKTVWKCRYEFQPKTIEKFDFFQLLNHLWLFQCGLRRVKWHVHQDLQLRRQLRRPVFHYSRNMYIAKSWKYRFSTLDPFLTNNILFWCFAMVSEVVGLIKIFNFAVSYEANFSTLNEIMRKGSGDFAQIQTWPAI